MPPRLDTWKLIAQHMGKSARTLQRWHRLYGLPIHHLSGESGSVYAYGEELDGWLWARGSLAGRTEPGVLPKTEASGEDLANGTQGPVLRGFGSDIVSAAGKQRSAQLLALNARMWDSLSARNVSSIVLHSREAVDLDPESAKAYAGLSMGLISQGIWGLVRPPAAFAAAKAAWQHALAIDSDLLPAKAAGAWLKMLVSRDWQGARNDFVEILKLEPTCAASLNGLALLQIAEGSLEKARKLLSRSAKQSPLSSMAMALCSWGFYLGGKFRHALELGNEMRASGHHDPVSEVVEALASIRQFSSRTALDRVEELAAGSPRNEALQGALGYIYAIRGDSLKAREVLSSLSGSSMESSSRDPYGEALIRIGLNEKQGALKCLKQSYEDGSLWSLGFRSDAMLESLHGDAECVDILNELDYPKSVGV